MVEKSNVLVILHDERDLDGVYYYLTHYPSLETGLSS